MSETDHSARMVRLAQHLKSHLTRLVSLFLEFARDSLCKFNATLQLCMPLLPALKTEVKRLLWGDFLNVREAGDGLADIYLTDRSLQLSDEELGIGHKTCDTSLLKNII